MVTHCDPCRCCSWPLTPSPHCARETVVEPVFFTVKRTLAGGVAGPLGTSPYTDASVCTRRPLAGPVEPEQAATSRASADRAALMGILGGWGAVQPRPSNAPGPRVVTARPAPCR